jgi:hypothetical protein
METILIRKGPKSRFVSQRSRATATFINAPVVRQPNSFAVWLILVGNFLPPVQIDLGAVNFTPGRIAVFLLLIPAVSALSKAYRTWIPSDFFAFATASWMIIASILNGGFRPYVGAEALEFLGAYLVGRAFFFGRPGLELFVRVIKVVACAVIALALLDTLSGRPVILQLAGLTGQMSQSDLAAGYRMGLVRASSTLLGGEQFGTFCVALVALFLYSERTFVSRILYVGLGILGSLLSLSSAPFLGLAIVLAVFIYDTILKKMVWRWKLLMTVLFGLILIAFMVLKNPIASIIGHLTFNPWSGYFRMITWNLSLDLVAQSPILGRAFNSFDGASPEVMFFVANSVDAVWLVEMLRYGLPMLAFLLLTIFVPIFKTHRISDGDPYLNRMRTGFTLLIAVMSVIGLTVHFWNTTWIFLSLCAGIRASFAELEARPPGGTQGRLSRSVSMRTI